ncbi:hypothetical protein Hypma_011740 [Hypsizygus marmoreus]|uniref:Transmembrane protein n=1 Tax=Hypsizygus marmoreus TaxID=39966 RepID=A0A369JQA6_HYPMA|nr:hypothetical protein Hypma_011740 [Hypsizygus marmoreus]
MSNTETATCTDTAFQWTFNSLNQSPCVIASYLGGVCNNGQFNVPPLSVDRVYLGPVPATANSCRCSSVFYSLIAACSACQTREWLNWSSYNTNCSTVYPGIFTGSIPSGTKVPHYAYIDVVGNDTFNTATAFGALDFPESSAIPQSTGTSTSSITGLPAPTQTTSSGSSKAGPIAGGVVGGVVFLAIVAAGLFWWIRRRRNVRTAPSAMVNTGYSAPPAAPPATTTPMSFTSAQPLTTMPAPRLYDPSDPSTYPSTAATSGVFTPPMQQQSLHPNHSGSTYYSAGQAPQTSRYTGAPEL